MGDWEIVHGVNLVNQHLAYATTRGARKRDWPQSFCDAAEWWKDYRPHADHLARLSLAQSAGRDVDLGRWHGSLAEVLVDGQRAALLGWPPWSADVPVDAGAHRVAVRVAATPRNVFGPFHDPRPEPRGLWPGHWALFADMKQPAGAEYDVVDYGLFEPPRLSMAPLGP
jgi:hypothetical protein